MKKTEQAIRETGVSASVTGAGSMFRIHLKPRPPRDYRQAYLSADENKRLKLLLDHMFDAGFILINSGSVALSTPMTMTEIDALVGALRSGFAKLAAMK